MLPAGWREAAAEHGLVLLFVGESLGLRDHTQGHQTNPGRRSAHATERGELAAGAIAYSWQKQPPRPAGDRAAGEYHPRPATLTRSTTPSPQPGGYARDF
jgi:hypothetical protein